MQFALSTNTPEDLKDHVESLFRDGNLVYTCDNCGDIGTLPKFTDSIAVKLPGNLGVDDALGLFGSKLREELGWVLAGDELTFVNGKFSARHGEKSFQNSLDNLSNERRLEQGKPYAAFLITDMIERSVKETGNAPGYSWRNEAFYFPDGASESTRSMMNDAAAYMEKLVADVGMLYGYGFGVFKNRICLIIEQDDLFKKVYGVNIYTLEKMIEESEAMFDDKGRSMGPPVMAMNREFLSGLKGQHASMLAEIEAKYAPEIWAKISSVAAEYGFKVVDDESSGVKYQRKLFVPLEDEAYARR